MYLIFVHPISTERDTYPIGQHEALILIIFCLIPSGNIWIELEWMNLVDCVCVCDYVRNNGPITWRVNYPRFEIKISRNTNLSKVIHTVGPVTYDHYSIVPVMCLVLWGSYCEVLVNPCDPFTHRLTLLPFRHGLVITSLIKYQINFLSSIHSQTWTKLWATTWMGMDKIPHFTGHMTT